MPFAGTGTPRAGAGMPLAGTGDTMCGGRDSTCRGRGRHVWGQGIPCAGARMPLAGTGDTTIRGGDATCRGRGRHVRGGGRVVCGNRGEGLGPNLQGVHPQKAGDGRPEVVQGERCRALGAARGSGEQGPHQQEEPASGVAGGCPEAGQGRGRGQASWGAGSDVQRGTWRRA